MNVNKHVHVRVHGHRFYRSLTTDVDVASVLGMGVLKKKSFVSRCSTEASCKRNHEYDCFKVIPFIVFFLRKILILKASCYKRIPIAK